MRRLLTVAFAFGCLTLFAGSAAAQDRNPPSLTSNPVVVPALQVDRAPLSEDQQRELRQWVDDRVAWDRQEKRWQNGPAHNNYGKIVQRKSEPEPPAWLAGHCTTVVVTRTDAHAPTIERACAMLRQLAVDPEAEAIRQRTLAVRADQEKVHKSSFFSRVHLDGLWSTTSSDMRYYGLVGSHISLVDVGRVQFFGPPGILLLRMPDVNGSHQIRIGYTWGLSVRLFDFPLFGSEKNTTMFLSIAKCWTVGNAMDSLNPGGFDIAGFSIAPRKQKQ
jgi:hypothetical protein